MSIEQEFKYRFIIDGDGNPKKVSLEDYNKIQARYAEVERNQRMEAKAKRFLLGVRIMLLYIAGAVVAVALAKACVGPFIKFLSLF